MNTKIHRMMSEARAYGIPWEDINGYLGDRNRKAQDAGFSTLQIAKFLGYSDPQLLRDRLSAEATVNYAMQD